MVDYITYLKIMIDNPVVKFFLRVLNYVFLLITFLFMYYLIGLLVGFIVKIKVYKDKPPIASQIALTFIFVFFAYALVHYKRLIMYVKLVLILLISYYFLLIHSRMDEYAQMVCVFMAVLCGMYVMARYVGIILKWDRYYIDYAYHGMNILIVLLLLWLLGTFIHKNILKFSRLDEKISPPFPKLKHVRKVIGKSSSLAIYGTITGLLFMLTFIASVFIFSLFSFCTMNVYIFIMNHIL